MQKVDTTKYEAAHGYKPRGYGAWTFQAIESGLTISLTAAYVKACQVARAFVNGAALEVLP